MTRRFMLGPIDPIWSGRPSGTGSYVVGNTPPGDGVDVEGGWVEEDDLLVAEGVVYQAGTGNSAAGTGFTIDTSMIPSGALMVFVGGGVDSGTWTMPGGWSLVFNDNAVAIPRTVCYSKISAGETSVVITRTGANLGIAGMIFAAPGLTSVAVSSRDYDTTGSVTIPNAPAGQAVFVYMTTMNATDISAYTWPSSPGYSSLSVAVRAGAANRLRFEAIAQAGGDPTGFSMNQGGTQSRCGFSIGLT